jgi:type I restriction enzyme, S subunit
LKREYFAELVFPLAPLAEQKRIVVKVEELLARVNAAREHLARVPAILKRFRQAVLAAACSGHLTADWRENRGSQRALPSNGMLMDQLADEPPFDLPEDWLWMPLDRLCLKITDGEHLTPPRVTAGVPILSAKDIRESDVDFSDPMYVTTETAKKSRQRCNPERGDVLVVSRGATVGRSCSVKTDRSFCLMGSVLLFKPDQALVIPQIIEYCFKSPLGIAALIARSGATAQQAIYIRDMRKFLVPLPPLEEQRKIAVRVNAIFAVTEEIEARVQVAKARAERTTRAVLAKAFQGELVPTEAELARAEGRPYEPASALLARIHSSQTLELLLGKKEGPPKGGRSRRREA